MNLCREQTNHPGYRWQLNIHFHLRHYLPHIIHHILEPVILFHLLVQVWIRLNNMGLLNLLHYQMHRYIPRTCSNPLPLSYRPQLWKTHRLQNMHLTIAYQLHFAKLLAHIPPLHVLPMHLLWRVKMYIVKMLLILKVNHYKSFQLTCWIFKLFFIECSSRLVGPMVVRRHAQQDPEGGSTERWATRRPRPARVTGRTRARPHTLRDFRR